METNTYRAIYAGLFILWCGLFMGLVGLGAFAYKDTVPGETPVCVEWWDNATHLLCSHYE